MASRRYARPLAPDDAEALIDLDGRYAERYGLERVVTVGSLGFYARSGHAFVALQGEAVTGFVLAHAVWNGARPVVQASRLAVAEAGDEASRALLLEALTKSAYDAAVYDVQIFHPEGDAAGAPALAGHGYRSTGHAVYRRLLGSRAQREA